MSNVSEAVPGAPAAESKTGVPAPAGALGAPQQPSKAQQQQQKNTKKDKKEKKGGAIAELSPPPEFFTDRIKIFDEHMEKYKAWVAEQPRDAITVTLPDGKEIAGVAWETTPMDIAKGISTSLADRVIIAKVNNQELWDLTRPLESSVELALLDFDSPQNDYEARQVFWHSSAHVLGEACERSYEGCCLGYGPPLPDGGFFYDMALANEKTLTQDDYKQIEEISKKAVKEKQKFERLSLPKEVLLEMFKVCRILAITDFLSTTSTSNIISTKRFPMAPLRRSTAVALLSIFAWVLTFPTLAASSLWPSRRTRRRTSWVTRTMTRSSVSMACHSPTRSR